MAMAAAGACLGTCMVLCLRGLAGGTDPQGPKACRSTTRTAPRPHTCGDRGRASPTPMTRTALPRGTGTWAGTPAGTGPLATTHMAMGRGRGRGQTRGLRGMAPPPWAQWSGRRPHLGTSDEAARLPRGTVGIGTGSGATRGIGIEIRGTGEIPGMGPEAIEIPGEIPGIGSGTPETETEMCGTAGKQGSGTRETGSGTGPDEASVRHASCVLLFCQLPAVALLYSHRCPGLLSVGDGDVPLHFR